VHARNSGFLQNPPEHIRLRGGGCSNHTFHHTKLARVPRWCMEESAQEFLRPRCG
jgi:hypothetical protein